MKSHFPSLACLAGVLLTIALLAAPAVAQTTTRVSLSSNATQGNLHSGFHGSSISISADGRLIAFESGASNLVPGDTNRHEDVFVHDRQTGQTRRVSVSSTGAQSNNASHVPFLSGDGRFVAFHSSANTLVPGDTNATNDCFVHDLTTGLTSRVSVDSAGGQGNAWSHGSSISADGRYAAFFSHSDNLVPGDTNLKQDAFVHDRLSGQTRRVSVDSSGVQGDGDSLSAFVSADGRFVAFDSAAGNLVPGDTNQRWDAFVHDLQTGQTSRASVDSAGLQGNGDAFICAISADGRHVVFQSDASNVVAGDTNDVLDCFVHDRLTSQTSRISLDSAGLQGNGASSDASISADGRWVGFTSGASNLVPGDTNAVDDVFLHDRVSGATIRVSVNFAGAEGSGWSGQRSRSNAGRFVTFASMADNLVPGDTNQRVDVFVRDTLATGPAITMAGACPGPVSLTVSNATPLGSVAILCGSSGIFVRTSPPCAGLMLAVVLPFQAFIRNADAGGAATLNFTAPPGVCGRSVQAVDVASCTATDVLVL
jgi:hypothetical protein